MSDESESLEARLNRLERRCRWQSRLMIALPVVGLMLGASASQMADWKGKSVTTEKLTLVDAQGKDVASLAAGANGAELMLRDAKGRTRARVAADFEGQGPAVFLVGENDKVRAVVRSFEDKTGPLFALTNEDGSTLVAAGRSKTNGVGFVDFHDSKGTWKGGVGGNGLK